ncbi:hypothetical protein OE88DRAFT_1660740 [Heliocybe sulcata]|uniref:Uncharacterized protein n=1 Tax=Heliocybe sulcata TaxID=5364 RepID=A0A5C3MYV7_9AGAM|nr:hypothetical protein OE88DRAFT_1660740 [Heliocybe sulcata]
MLRVPHPETIRGAQSQLVRVMSAEEWQETETPGGHVNKATIMGHEITMLENTARSTICVHARSSSN